MTESSVSTHKHSKIFVSHSSVDVAIVGWLKDQVEAMGNFVWVAEWDLQAGESVTKQVLEAIGECDAYIILLTRDGYNSTYVAHETGAAVASGKPVIGSKVLRKLEWNQRSHLDEDINLTVNKHRYFPTLCYLLPTTAAGDYLHGCNYSAVMTLMKRHMTGDTGRVRCRKSPQCELTNTTR